MNKARQFYRQNNRKVYNQLQFGRKLAVFINLPTSKKNFPNKLDSTVQRIIRELDQEDIVFEGVNNHHHSIV